MSGAPRRLIIDGYNVLHASPEYRALMERDLALARDRLLDDVASHAAGGWDVTVVFDGAGEERGTLSHGGVRTIYSKAGEDADTIIEALARDVRDERGSAVVVTSDAVTQSTVFGGGVVRMSSRQFLAELAEGTAERREHHAGRGRKSTVADRLDDSTRSGLFRLRDR